MAIANQTERTEYINFCKKTLKSRKLQVFYVLSL